MKLQPSQRMALGIAMGVAIGVATHNMGVWIPIGAAMGIIFSRSSKNNNCPTDSTTDKSNPPKVL